MPPRCEISTVPVFILCISIYGPSFWHVCPYSGFRLETVGLVSEQRRVSMRAWQTCCQGGDRGLTKDRALTSRHCSPFPNEDRLPIRDSSGHCPLANWRLFTMNVVFQKSDTPCNKIMFTTSAHVSINMHLLFTFPVIYWKFAPIRPALNISCPSFCPVSFSYYSMSLSALY